MERERPAEADLQPASVGSRRSVAPTPRGSRTGLDSRGIGIALEGEIAGPADLVIVPLNDPTLAAGHYVTAPENMQLVAAIEAFFEIATGTETHRETNGDTK